MSVRSEVIHQFHRVAREQNKSLAPLSDDLPLIDCGLDSLCFALIASRLEDSMEIDPLAGPDDSGFPLTLGEFVRFYENAAR